MSKILKSLAFAFVACLPMSCTITRSEARSALVVSAKGVLWANDLCAKIGRVLSDTRPKEALDGLTMCSRVSKMAFTTLENAELLLEREGAEAAFCAVKTAVEAIRAMVGFTKDHGAAIPEKIVDVLDVTKLVGAQCQ